MASQSELLRYNPRENPFTIYALMEIAGSDLAHKRVDDYYQTKAALGILVIDDCSDARLRALLETTSVNRVSSVATGVRPEKFLHLYMHRAVNHILVLNHYDGKLWQRTIEEKPEKESPEGCGGFGAYQKIDKTQTDDGQRDSLDGFVVRLGTGDPAKKSLIKASAIARITDQKPVFASVVDHLDGGIRLLAAFINNHGTINSWSSFDLMSYDPKEVYYKATINQLELEGLPDEIRLQAETIIEENKKQLRLLDQSGINLKKLQKIQDPSMLLITTKPASLRTRLPGFTDIPNSVFSIRTPIQKIGVAIDMDYLLALAQTRYVINHGIESYQKGQGPFLNTRTILIESQCIDAAETIGLGLRRIPNFQSWLNLPGSQVFAAVVPSKKGLITYVEKIL